MKNKDKKIKELIEAGLRDNMEKKKKRRDRVSQLKKDTRSRVGEVNGVDADSERDNLEDR